MDGVRYHGIDKRDLPPAWVKLPVKVEQAEGDIQTDMFAGLMGIGLSSKDSSPTTVEEQVSQTSLPSQGLDNMVLNTMAPVAAWWIVE
jgi:hypothetical protein